jgi:hypothetical protein
MSIQDPDFYVRPKYFPAVREEWTGSETHPYRRDEDFRKREDGIMTMIQKSATEKPATDSGVHKAQTESHRDKILAAIAQGSNTSAKIAQHTGLDRKQVRNSVYKMVKSGILASKMVGKDMVVDVAGHDSADKQTDKASSAAITKVQHAHVPENNEAPMVRDTATAASSKTVAETVQDTTVSADNGTSVDQLVSAIMDSLGKLRVGISQLGIDVMKLSDIARKNESAKERLSVIQKMLDGKGV